MTTPAAPLSALESDPLHQQWMQGAPPAPDRLVSAADMSHFTFPSSRWAFANMRQLLPSTQIWRGRGPCSVLPDATSPALDAAIDAVSFTPIGGNATMTWRESLDANYTDAIVVLHRGRVVYERYFGVMTPHRVHMAMSVTKSYTGTIAAMLVHAGELDETKPVAFYVPEMAGTAYDGASVRDVMDMRIGVAYSENYADPNAGIWEHARAGGNFPRPAGYAGATSYYGFLRTLEQDGPPPGPFDKLRTGQAQGGPAPAGGSERSGRGGAVPHGRDFFYKTVNTDLLGWIIRRVTGRAYGDLLSEWFWQALGCEEDACMLVDSEGTEFAGGGLNATLRDMARFGEAMRLAGEGEGFNGKTIVPPAVVHDVRTKGSAEAFEASGPPTLPGGAYRSMWWVLNNAHGTYAARGIHGQAIVIDPKAQVVIARFGSHPLAANVHFDPTSLPAYEAVARWLMANAR